VAFIAWLITLITGKLPAPLHLAFTAVLRYQTRYFCYIGLLTPTYPWKLFGDEPDASAPVPAAPAESVAPAGATETAPPVVETAWGTPPGYESTAGYGSTTPGYGTAPGYGTTPGYGTPQSVYGTPSGYGSGQPASPSVDWPLVLPRSAKALLIAFIVLGVITDIGGNVASVAFKGHANSRALALSQWNTADNALNTEMTAWTTSITACDQSQSLGCATAADAKAASYMSAFARQVQAIAMPTAATSAAAAKVVADATRTSADLTTVSQDTTVAQYQADMASSGLSPDLDAVQSDIGSLANALGNSDPM